MHSGNCNSCSCLTIDSGWFFLNQPFFCLHLDGEYQVGAGKQAKPGFLNEEIQYKLSDYRPRLPLYSMMFSMPWYSISTDGDLGTLNHFDKEIKNIMIPINVTVYSSPVAHVIFHFSSSLLHINTWNCNCLLIIGLPQVNTDGIIIIHKRAFTP